MRVKRAKKLFRKDKDTESSRPGLFVLLLICTVLVTGLTGFFIFNSSENAKETVERESQLYELAKNQQNQSVANNITPEPTQAEPAEIDSSAKPSAVGTALVYFSKYPDSNSDEKQLISVERAIYQGQDPISSAVKDLISGPSSAEKAEGFFGGIELTGDSNCDGEDFKIMSDEGSIKLQFCRGYSGSAVLDDKLHREQIIKTISGISGQTNVFVLDKSGKCLFNQSLGSC